MKALILCGGKGSRLKPLTDTIPKSLLPIANRPIIFYILDKIKDTGINEVGIVVSPENHDPINNIIGQGEEWNLRVSYITQKKPLGLANAVKVSRKYLGNSPFLMFLGDNLIRIDIQALIQQYHENNADAVITLMPVEDPRMFGVAVLDDKGKIVKLVEKPEKQISNLAILGIYIFSPAIYQAINSILPSWRGELEITDAIQELLNKKKVVEYHIHTGKWLDIGKKEDLLKANRIVLEENSLKNTSTAIIEPSSEIVGEVFLGDNIEIENSRINGPCSLADNCRVIDSYIGHFTSIDKNVVIERSYVENSVILTNSRIVNVNRMTDSIIGRNCRIFRTRKGDKEYSLFTADNEVLEL